VFGGFAGRFIKQFYLFNTNTNQIDTTGALPKEIFPYQTPTIHDASKKTLYTIDWQTFKLFSYNEQRGWVEGQCLK
jgi:hypothetical protein